MKSYELFRTKTSDVGSLLLDVPKDYVLIPEWLQELSVTEEYDRKKEYHITVIGDTLAKKIAEAGLTETVNAMIEHKTWNMEQLGTYVELAKNRDGINRRSIIQLISAPEVILFIEDLASMLGQSIKSPVPHLTLYTKNYDRGIGIYNEDDLLRFAIKEIYP